MNKLVFWTVLDLDIFILKTVEMKISAYMYEVRYIFKQAADVQYAIKILHCRDYTTLY